MRPHILTAMQEPSLAHHCMYVVSIVCPNLSLRQCDRTTQQVDHRVTVAAGEAATHQPLPTESRGRGRWCSKARGSDRRHRVAEARLRDRGGVPRTCTLHGHAGPPSRLQMQPSKRGRAAALPRHGPLQLTLRHLRVATARFRRERPGPIVQIKRNENKGISMEAWCRQILGCARSMGVRVVARPEDA